MFSQKLLSVRYLPLNVYFVFENCKKDGWQSLPCAMLASVTIEFLRYSLDFISLAIQTPPTKVFLRFSILCFSVQLNVILLKFCYLHTMSHLFA